MPRVLAALDAAHQSLVAIRIKKVGEGNNGARLLEDPVERRIHSRRDLSTGPEMLFLVERREHLPVVPERTVHRVARGIAHEPVGTTHGDAASAGELLPGAVLGHLVVQLLGFEREGPRTGEAFAHLPNECVGARIHEARAWPDFQLDQGRRRLG